jgi:hypothetical protein
MFGAAGLMFVVAQVLTMISPEVATKDKPGRTRSQSIVSKSAGDSSTTDVPGDAKADPKDAFATAGFESERSRQAASRRANEQQEASLASQFDDIRSEQQRIERSQSRLDARLSERLQGAPQIRTETVREDVRMQLDEVAKERTRQRQVLTEVYNRMSVDGVAAVVDDLVESGRIDSATTVLSVLEDRSAARVLAIVAGPRPDAAAMITARLQNSSIR